MTLRALPPAGLVALSLLLALGCDDGGSDADADADGDLADLGAPGGIEPTDPGLLVVRPAALVLAPEEEATREVRLFDSVGAELAPPAALVFASEPAEVATVASDGRVTALAGPRGGGSRRADARPHRSSAPARPGRSCGRAGAA